MKKKTLVGCLSAISCETLYGLSYLFTKTATGSAGELQLLGWRFAAALLFFTLLRAGGVIHIDLKGKPVWPLVRAAILCPGVYFFCEVYGISLTTAAESGTMLASIPMVSMLLSSVMLKKRPTLMQKVGAPITLVGVVMSAVSAGMSVRFSPLGYLLLMGGVLVYALYSVYVARAEGYSGAELTYAMLLCAAVVYVPAAIVEGAIHGTLGELVRLPFVNGGFALTVVCQGLGCSVLAFFLGNVAISTLGVNRTASFIGISTLVSIVAGVLVLGEPFTLLQGVGAVLIVLGVTVANTRTE